MADDDNIQRLQERLASDDALRARFQRSPHEVIQEHGISLTPEQHAKLTGLKLHEKSDDELKGMVKDTATLKRMMF